MKLSELIQQYHSAQVDQKSSPRRSEGVPDWMLGCLRRRSISFANGYTDTDTIVYWFQSRNFTIDLRLPKPADQPPAIPLSACTPGQIATLANNEGWQADSHWDGANLAWHGGTSFQLHNRWPEPAELRRVGNCMIEFSPSGAYVEDWRLQMSAPGPLVGLRMLEELEVDSGKVQHRHGGLIICGDHAALVQGRATELEESLNLPSLAADSIDSPAQLEAAFNFDTSVARGSLDTGYTVEHSINPSRVGHALLPLDGFDWHSQENLIRQVFNNNGKTYERWFSIDTIEPEFVFKQSTETSASSREWFESEASTLTRYTKPLT